VQTSSLQRAGHATYAILSELAAENHSRVQFVMKTLEIVKKAEPITVFTSISYTQDAYA
jgi:hypothetical protein